MPFNRRQPKRPPSEDDHKNEHQIQSKLVDQLTQMVRPGVHFYAIPNGDLRHWNVAVRLKAQGVKRGVADLFFIGPNKWISFLEMKTKRGSLSDEQIGFHAICDRCGIPWAMARNVEDALTVVGSWGLLRSNYGNQYPTAPEYRR